MCSPRHLLSWCLAHQLCKILLIKVFLKEWSLLRLHLSPQISPNLSLLIGKVLSHYEYHHTWKEFLDSQLCCLALVVKFLFHDITVHTNGWCSFVVWLTENASNSNCRDWKSWWHAWWSRSTCPAVSRCSYFTGNHLHHVVSFSSIFSKWKYANYCKI
jgi:hypothetical protein